MRYNWGDGVITSFRHKGLELFFSTGSTAGIQHAHAVKLRYRLALLDVVKSPVELNLPGWRLHRLRGDLNGRWSVRVSGNWRLVFRFNGNHVEQVDYLDYH